MTSIFAPYDLQDIRLNNRVVMAPMTRSRASEHDVPNELGALYYRQRASAGLIISEGSPISREGQGYLFNPGIFSPDQIAGWKKATDAVHERGGKIFCQTWHVGRVSHTSIQQNGAAPISSTTTQGGMAFGYNEDGMPDMLAASKPRAATTEECGRLVRDFAQAAVNARQAGFDGVELHGANGYLLEQFINGALNDRDDAYGGSREKRCRLLLESIDASVALIGAHRVGVRLTPYATLFDMPLYDDIEGTYLYLAEELGKRGLAYVHLMDQGAQGQNPLPRDFLRRFREAYTGTLLFAGNLDREEAQRLVDEGTIDLPVFGRPFTSNPDLVERMENDWPLTPFDPDTFYGGDARGYVDFPTYQEEQTRKAREKMLADRA
ncbi:alkene reductase [Larsenimonas rhizosphaerae]|uniref:alkene reductase n=1 Tax=Larsenimonas rhizosphaerae TaxID=2944682 RepID=UPI002034639A|nr:alkene reductase [Larsenimonas rhizosphaerae]MCM2129433.1 alkene reductase [Larsenimonas rhizosphaerae]